MNLRLWRLSGTPNAQKNHDLEPSEGGNSEVDAFGVRSLGRILEPRAERHRAIR